MHWIRFSNLLIGGSIIWCSAEIGRGLNPDGGVLMMICFVLWVRLRGAEERK